MLVSNGTREQVASDLNRLFLSSAALNTAIFTVILCCELHLCFCAVTLLGNAFLSVFSARPPTPPSRAQITAQEEKAIDSKFWRTLAKLVTSRNFALLFVTYGELEE